MVERRSVLGGLGAAAILGAAGLPIMGTAATGTAQGIKLPRLRAGDTVGLICPAGFVADRFGVEQISQTVRAMGLVPKAGSHLLSRYGYMAGTDEQRASDVQAMFADDTVRAIFAVRGGWGCQRLLPLLDFDAIRQTPKLLVGSSDITSLLLALWAKAGFGSIHGPNAAHSWPKGVWTDFQQLAFTAATPTYALPPPPNAGNLVKRTGLHTFRGGKARGRLLGGNLSVLAAMVGTPYLPDFSGAILFLEETNEAEYRVDRLLTQLAQSGVLENLAGVVFGQCTNCSNPGAPYGNFTVYEVMDSHFSKLGVPAFEGARFGHIAGTLSLPVGTMAEIDADSGTIQILESLVA